MAITAALASAAFAQTGGASAGAPPNMPDMRLWSFGECDNRYPFVNSAEHKECVRVVGSEEARDARAFRVCETTNTRDPEEVARCKATYQKNKHAAAQSGYVPNATQTQAPPSEEELKRVKAIAAAAVERDKEAARAAAIAASAAEPDEPIESPEEESGFSMSLVIAFGFTVLLLGGLAANRRKQGGTIFGR